MFPPKFLSFLLTVGVGVQIAQGTEDLFLKKLSKQSVWLCDSHKRVVSPCFSLSCSKQKIKNAGHPYILLIIKMHFPCGNTAAQHSREKRTCLHKLSVFRALSEWCYRITAAPGTQTLWVVLESTPSMSGEE